MGKAALVMANAQFGIDVENLWDLFRKMHRQQWQQWSWHEHKEMGI